MNPSPTAWQIMRKNLQKLKSLAKSSKKIKKRRVMTSPLPKNQQPMAPMTMRLLPMMPTRVHPAIGKVVRGEPIPPRTMIEQSMAFLEEAIEAEVVACAAIVGATEDAAMARSVVVVEASIEARKRTKMAPLITRMVKEGSTEVQEEAVVVQEEPEDREEDLIIEVEVPVNIESREVVVVGATRTTTMPRLSTSQQRSALMPRAALKN